MPVATPLDADKLSQINPTHSTMYDKPCVGDQHSIEVHNKILQHYNNDWSTLSTSVSQLSDSDRSLSSNRSDNSSSPSSNNSSPYQSDDSDNETNNNNMLHSNNNKQLNEYQAARWIAQTTVPHTRIEHNSNNKRSKPSNDINNINKQLSNNNNIIHLPGDASNIKQSLHRLHGINLNDQTVDIPIMRPEQLIELETNLPVQSLLSYIDIDNTTELTDQQIQSIFDHFDVDINNGFLPSHQPIQRCDSDKFQAWEDLLSTMTARLQCHDYQAFRQCVEQLPLVNITTDDCHNKYELNRAMMVCSMLAHGYVWCMTPAATHLPECLSRPWVQLSILTGHVPVLTYSSIVLNNWQRWNHNRSIELGNISTVNLFYGGVDEAHFFLVSTAIEGIGARMLKHMIRCQLACAKNNVQDVINELYTIVTVQKEIRQILRQMYNYCDPYIFFQRVRPFVDGWKGSAGLPNGLIYDGVDNNAAIFLHGGSAAQSSLIAALDEFFGVRHTSDHTREYMAGMRYYMPRGHRQFLLAIRKASEHNGDLRTFMLKYAENATVTLEKLHNEQVKCPFSQAKQQHNNNNNVDTTINEQHHSNSNNDAKHTNSNVNDKSTQQNSSWAWNTLTKFNIFRSNNNNDVQQHNSNNSTPNSPSNQSSSTTTVQCPYNDLPAEPQVFALLQAYDSCLAEMTAFRNLHLQIIHSYIIKQITAKSAGSSTAHAPYPTDADEARGTGGTTLLPFLQTARDETKQCTITKHRATVNNTRR